MRFLDKLISEEKNHYEVTRKILYIHHILTRAVALIDLKGLNCGLNLCLVCLKKVIFTNPYVCIKYLFRALKAHD